MAPTRTKRLATIFSVILIIPPRARTSEQRPAPAVAAAQLYILQGGQSGLCKMIARKILDAANEIPLSGNYEFLSPISYCRFSQVYG
jgi:hypothetical protein